MTTPGNTGGQQPSPPTDQTSAQAGGSIRERLSSPRSSDQASGPGDTRTSGLREGDFQQTDSAAALIANSAGEQQYDSSSPPVATAADDGPWLQGAAPFAIVLGLLGLLLAGAVLVGELTDLTFPWADLGPWTVVAAGLVIVLVGAIGLRSSRRAHG